MKQHKPLYVGYTKEYDDKITVKRLYRRSRLKMRSTIGSDLRSSVTGYTKPWLAVLTSIPDLDKYVSKGYAVKKSKLTPYIKEKYTGAFDDLYDKSCFLYKVDPSPFSKVDLFKYISHNTVDVVSKEYIFDVFTYLRSYGVRMVKITA